MKKNAYGFSVVAVFSLLLIIGFIGFAGWYVWQNNQDKEPSTDKVVTTNTSNGQEQESAVPGSYQSKEAGITFSYPKEWGAIKEQKNDYTTKEYRESKEELGTGYSGKIIYLSFAKKELEIKIATKDLGIPKGPLPLSYVLSIGWDDKLLQELQKDYKVEKRQIGKNAALYVESIEKFSVETTTEYIFAINLSKEYQGMTISMYDKDLTKDAEAVVSNLVVQ